MHAAFASNLRTPLPPYSYGARCLVAPSALRPPCYSTGRSSLGPPPSCFLASSSHPCVLHCAQPLSIANPGRATPRSGVSLFPPCPCARGRPAPSPSSPVSSAHASLTNDSHFASVVFSNLRPFLQLDVAWFLLLAAVSPGMLGLVRVPTSSTLRSGLRRCCLAMLVALHVFMFLYVDLASPKQQQH
jgi:hypothetical protein